MSLILYKLRDLIPKEGDDNDLRSLLSSFKCSAEPAAENFLKNIAIKHEKKGISRTYLFIEEGYSGRDAVRGFFTLAVKCLAVDENHAIPDEILELMNVDRGVAQAYLLGQLAKADGAERGFGKAMIKHAFDVFSKSNEMLGCRVVRLDCKDKLLEYYGTCGFSHIGKNQSGTLNQMVSII